MGPPLYAGFVFVFAAYADCKCSSIKATYFLHKIHNFFFLNPERSKCISNVYAVWKKKLFQLSVHVTYWNNFSYAYHFCFFFCVFNIFNSARINLHFYFTIFFFHLCSVISCFLFISIIHIKWAMNINVLI
jgi:hypothetical protein